MSHSELEPHIDLDVQHAGFAMGLTESNPLDMLPPEVVTRAGNGWGIAHAAIWGESSPWHEYLSRPTIDFELHAAAYAAGLNKHNPLDRLPVDVIRANTTRGMGHAIMWGESSPWHEYLSRQ